MLETFHQGEQSLQDKLGLKERMQSIGDKVIRPFMPFQHRELFAQLPLIFIGGSDSKGQPWASLRTGRPGFIHTPDDQTLVIDAPSLDHDPLEQELNPGENIGLLGIEFETRRRNRVNGVILENDGHKLVIQVKQSFGNCPKYIQTRQSKARHNEKQSTFHVFQCLTPQTRAMIEQADSFFIASQYNEDLRRANQGSDVSHRGGKPSFVRVDNSQSLTIPDFSGNRFFNTLGNLICDPRAGLTFIDYSLGHVLYLAGVAEIIEDEKQVLAYKGAERLLKLTIKEGRYVSNVLPYQWDFEGYSPALIHTGEWVD